MAAVPRRPIDRPSQASHLVQRRQGQAWVKKANLDRIRAELDLDPDAGLSDDELEQRRMAWWLTTGTTWRGDGPPPR